MPHESYPHTRTWMSFPCANQNNDTPGAREAFASVAKRIAEFEPVVMLAQPGRDRIARIMCDAPNLRVATVKIDDSWIRDSGPSFLIDGEGHTAGVSWIFNAYGGKFAHKQDSKLSQRLLRSEQFRAYRAPIVLEGGSIQSDGDGTLLATRQSVFGPGRNPGLSVQTVNNHLNRYTGTEKTIFLSFGLADDKDTDGHVDNVAAFARPGIAMALAPVHRNHENFFRLKHNINELARSRDAMGRKLHVIEIPEPEQYYDDGLVRSYLNFYLVNGGVLCPVFGDPSDDRALRILQDAFPGRKIVEVPEATEIIRGGGGLHCITQPEFAPVRA